MVICEYLLDGCLLIPVVNRVGCDAMDDHSIGRHNKLGARSQAPEPSLAFLQLRSFGSRAGKYLYVATLKLVCRDYLDVFRPRIVLNRDRHLLSDPG